MYESISIMYDGNEINMINHGGYETRNPATFELIKTAWEKYIKGNTNTKKEFIIHTGDGFIPECDYSYAITSPEDIKKCFPNFVYHSWPEVGITDYKQIFNDMIEAGKQPSEDDRVF